MLKDTKSLGNNKAPAWESRGFVKWVFNLEHFEDYIIYSSIIPTNLFSWGNQLEGSLLR